MAPIRETIASISKKIRTRLDFTPRYSVEDGIRELLVALEQDLFADAEVRANFYGNYELNYPVDNVSHLPDQVVDCLRDILGDTAGLHEPCFQGNEWDYVKECIDTGWVSAAGSYVGRFEDMLANFHWRQTCYSNVQWHRRTSRRFCGNENWRRR